MRSCLLGGVALGLAAFLPAACGSSSAAPPSSGSDVIVTDFKTYPPPTTTVPPTTTTPPEPGSVLASEAAYVVQDGDFPFVVADRLGVNFDELIALNGWTVDDGFVLEWPDAGTTIRIPAGATVPEGPSVLIPVIPPDAGPDATIATSTGGTSTGENGTGTVTTDPAVATSVADDGDGCGTYRIVAGDYLGRVATKLNTTVDELNRANDDTDGYAAFYVGLLIDVPC